MAQLWSENDTGKGSKTRLDRTFAGGYHCATLSRLGKIIVVIETYAIN